MHYYNSVVQFLEKYSLQIPEDFTIIAPALQQLRIRLFHEELHEFIDSHIINRTKLEQVSESIDAIVDLIYVTCGCAALTGIDEYEFNNLVYTNTIEFNSQIFNKKPINNTPNLIDYDNFLLLTGILSLNIIHYEYGYERQDVQLIKNSLARIYLNCSKAYEMLGFNKDQFTELFDDVHRANMSKVRAERNSDSKRGSTFDIIKPAGWIGPQTEHLVNKFIGY